MRRPYTPSPFIPTVESLRRAREQLNRLRREIFSVLRAMTRRGVALLSRRQVQVGAHHRPARHRRRREGGDRRREGRGRRLRLAGGDADADVAMGGNGSFLCETDRRPKWLTTKRRRPILPKTLSAIFDDLAALRKASKLTVKRKTILVNVPVGKPPSNVHFRTHPTLKLVHATV